MIEFVSGYTLYLALLVSFVLTGLAYAYYTMNKRSELPTEHSLTIHNFIENITEAPEQKKVSKEYIETLDAEMSRLEQKIASLKNINSKSEGDTLRAEIIQINQKIANCYMGQAV